MRSEARLRRRTLAAEVTTGELTRVAPSGQPCSTAGGRRAAHDAAHAWEPFVVPPYQVRVSIPPAARTLGQGRESRLWCMLVSERMDAGDDFAAAAASAAPLVVDEVSPLVDALDSGLLATTFARLRAVARGCAPPRTRPKIA
jgi:hypothetical protein